MATRPSRKRTVAVLLDRHGQTFAAELGIPIARGTPSPLFRLLCASLLFSARIAQPIATEAARALQRQGWGTARAMARATWAQRTRVLNRAGYARYDESTSRMLGETAELLLDRYGGDLRRLREQAGRDPEQERRLIRECKGIGPAGADIFSREVQGVWDEHRPFADRRALRAAERLGLPDSARGLARLVERDDLPRLVAALVRADLTKDHDGVLAAASGAGGQSR